MSVALRTALIWHDEVMNDVVVDEPTTITLGRSGKSTFVVPDVGLPADFAIVRPGNRGYLLTLGENMRGTICVDGAERPVRELVDAEGSGGFHATPIGAKDWGVIELDESGHYKLFFQFVQVDEPPQFFTRKMILAGLGGYALAALALMVLWLVQGQDVAEAAFRGFGMSTITLGAAAVVWSIARQDPDSQASLAFSIVLHAALLYTTYALYDGTDPFEWPGPRGLAGNYLVTKIEQEPPPEPPKPTPTIGKVNAKDEAAAANPNPKNVKTATKNDEGAAGGKGETERARDPNAKDAPPEPPKVAFFEDKNRKMLDNIIDRNLATNLGKFTGIEGATRTRGSIGFGPGDGSGVGGGKGTGTTRGSKGTGTGGGGQVEGDFVTNKGPIDTGKNRPGGTCVGAGCQGAAPKPVSVAIATGTGDFGGYTEDEINRIVKARAGVFRACYQKELNRSPGIGGKLVIRFKIGSDGTVQSAANAGGSSLTNAEVESCVKSNVMRLKFTAKGAIANVTYPFVFSQGG